MGDTWHLDEVFVTIRGKLLYLWRAVDQDGDTINGTSSALSVGSWRDREPISSGTTFVAITSLSRVSWPNIC